MAIFKLAIGYEGRSAQEIVEIDAPNPPEARKKCEEMLAWQEKESERLAAKNVYNSKVVKSCELCKYDFRMDFIALEEMLRSLENRPLEDDV